MSFYVRQSVNTQLSGTARGMQHVRHPGPRWTLAAPPCTSPLYTALLCTSLLCTPLFHTSLATAREPTSDVATAAEATAASAPEPTLPASSSPPTSAKADDHRWLAWTAVGVGGGLLAVSAWQWLVFANESSEGNDVCPARSAGLARCDDAEGRARYLSARDDAKQARALGAIFGGLGAAALVAGILLLPDSDSGAGQPSVAISADPLAGDARASVSWKW